VWDLASDRLTMLSEANDLPALTWQDLAGAVDIGKAKRDDLLALITTRGYTAITGSSDVLKAFRGELQRYEYQDQALAISPDGQFLAGVGHGSPLRIYDLERKIDSHKEHDGHTHGVQAVIFSPDGRQVITGGADSTVRVWDVQTTKQIAKLNVGDAAYTLRFAPDGKLLAIGNGSGVIHLWNMKDEEADRIHSQAGWITGLVFDPKHGELLSVGTSAVIHFHDVKTRQTRRVVRTWCNTRSVGVSRDGLWVITGAGDFNGTDGRRYPLFWPRPKFPEPNADTPVELTVSQVVRPPTEETHTSEIDRLDVSPDGSLLATGSGDASVRLWDMKTLRPIAKLCGHTDGLTDVKFSPDGKWLASSSWDGTAKIWDVHTHRQLAVLDADVYRVEGVAFSPDGLGLATANADGTAHVWDLSGLR
jgi:WD40 repeat protein